MQEFESGFFGELLQSLEIVKTRTTAYQPSSNCQVEHYNRSVLQILRCFLEGHHRAWAKHLLALAMALWVLVSTITGFTPNFLMFREVVKLPAALFLGLPTLQESDVEFRNTEKMVVHHASKCNQRIILMDKVVLNTDR